MTNEKRYELVCNMLRAYDVANDTKGGAEMVIKDPQAWQKSTYFPFYADAAKLLLEAKQGIDKAKSGGSVISALTRIYKNCGDARPNMQGVFKSGDRWAICDGYRFVRVNDKPESIPEVPGGIDLDQAIPKDAHRAELVDLPSVGDIKVYMAAHKQGRGKYEPIEAAPGWWCNPQYLIDMIQAIPDGRAHKPDNERSAMYYAGESGDAVLLPVRHSAA